MAGKTTDKKTKKDRTEAGREFIQGFLQTFPDDLKTQIAAILTDEVIASDALEPVAAFAGDHALRQSEFSRFMDQGRDEVTRQRKQNDTYKAELDAWYAANQKKIDEFDALRAELDDLKTSGTRKDSTDDPASDPPPTAQGTTMTLPKHLRDFDPAKLLTPDQVSRMIAEHSTRLERDMLGFFSLAQPLAIQHHKDFGEVLDFKPILAHPKVQEIGLMGAYNDLMQEKIEEKRAAQEKEEREQLEREIRTKVEEEYRSQASRPYPVGMEASDLGTLAPLHKAQAAQNGSHSEAIDRATRGYLEAMQKRLGT